MLSSQNSGKYLTRSYERDKNAGELDSSNLTTDEKAFLEIQDGEGQIKINLEKLRRKTDDPHYDADIEEILEIRSS
jgi:hypothetical protein